MSAPASRRPGPVERHGRAPWRSARRARLARMRRRCSELVRAVGPPTMRAIARALPPVASASSGSGGAIAAKASQTAACARARARRRRRIAVRAATPSAAASRCRPSEPRRARAGQVPTTISVEPPPTSQTATTPSPAFVARDCAGVRQAALLLGGDDADAGRRSPGRASWTRRSGRVALAARGGDDGLELSHPVLRARSGRIGTGDLRSSSSLRRRMRPWRRISSPSPRCARSSRSDRPRHRRRTRRAGARCSSRRR